MMENKKTFPVKFGDRVVGRGWVKEGDVVTIEVDPINQNVIDFLVGDAYKYFSIFPEPALPQSNLVDHAKRELNLLGEDPEIVEGYIKVIRAFADMGHSGGSASVAIPVIHELLQFHNLKALTDDPAEWMFHGPDVAGGDGIWQNIRRSEAFSHNGGKTYYLLSENTHRGDPTVWHDSEPKLIDE